MPNRQQKQQQQQQLTPDSIAALLRSLQQQQQLVYSQGAPYHPQQQHLQQQQLPGQTLPALGLSDLAAALADPSRGLPDNIRALLAGLGVPAVQQQQQQQGPTSIADALAAAAASLAQPSYQQQQQQQQHGVKRTASMAGLQQAAAALAPALRQQQQQYGSLGGDQSAVSLLQQLVQQSLDPAGAAAAAAGGGRLPVPVGGSNSSSLASLLAGGTQQQQGQHSSNSSAGAAAIIESLGLPFDADKARMIEHISGMLRQRGITSEAQVSAFISALPAAVAAHAAQAAASRPAAAGGVHSGVQGVNSLSEVLASLDESAIVQATEGAVAVALQVPLKSVTKGPKGSVTDGAALSDDATATVVRLLEQQPGISQLLPGRLQSLAAALVAQLHNAASNGTLDRALVQQMLQQAQQVAAAALVAQQQRQQQQQDTAVSGLDAVAAAAAASEHVDPAAELSPVQSAAVTLLTSVGAKVTVRRLSAGGCAAGTLQQGQQLEVVIVLPQGLDRSEIEQLLPKLQLPNLHIIPAPAAAAGAAQLKQADPAAPAAAAATTPTAAATQQGSAGEQAAAESNAVSSIINVLQLHTDLVGILVLAEPGSLRHKSIQQTLELLEGSEAFLTEVQRHEAAAAATSAAGDGTAQQGSSSGVTAKVQFMMRPRPAALDLPLSRDGSASYAKTQHGLADLSGGEGSGLSAGSQGLGAVPGHTTRAGLAALSAQLNMHMSHLKEVRSQIEVQAQQAGISLSDPAALAAAGVGSSSSIPASAGAPACPSAAAAAAAANLPADAAATQGSLLFRTCSVLGSKDAAGGLSAAAAGAGKQAAPRRLSSGGGSAGAVPAAAAAAAADLPGSLPPIKTGHHSSGPAAQQPVVTQQQALQQPAAAARGGSVTPSKIQASAAAAATAAAASPAAAAVTGTTTAAMDNQQQQQGAAAAAGGDSRVAWQATVVAPSTGTLNSKGVGSNPSPEGLAKQGSAAIQGSGEGAGLVQLFAVAGELAPEVAGLLPDVLVVTAKQLRSEIMVDVAQVRITSCFISCYVTCRLHGLHCCSFKR
jgi:hypothetical protein